MSDKRWMQSAVKHPGALRATAEKHGAITRDGTIKADWLDQAASGKYGDVTQKRAVLAKTFKKYSK